MIKSAIARATVRKFRRSNVYRISRRWVIVNSYQRENRKLARSWIFKRTEQSNFYYHLAEKNREDLLSTISLITGVKVETLRTYLNELIEDLELHEHLKYFLLKKKETRDSIVGFGRREGWYLFVRAMKPKLVVETGVHHGVGACLIASALLKNIQEGHMGRYLGTEINRNSGSLFTGRYSAVGDITYGDSCATLSSLETEIDIFINDSDHSAEYESKEYETVQNLLSYRSVILGDNSHVTNCLRNFSEKNERHYIFFKEIPHDHWYPGGGIGISPSHIPLTAN